MSKNSSCWLGLIEPRRLRAASINSALLVMVMCALLSSLPGCTSLPLEEEKVENEPELIVEETPAAVIESGIASYYGNRHQNQKTASGERYQHELKTAAHKTLPLGSYVKVTNKKNGQSVVVKINDRGPFVRGRIIDLSKSAFAEIGNTSSGLIKVDIQVVE